MGIFDIRGRGCLCSGGENLVLSGMQAAILLLDWRICGEPMRHESPLERTEI